MRVCMIGLGKLGLPVSCAMCLKGHEVWGYDIDTDKVARFQDGISDLYEPRLDDILTRLQAEGKLHITHNITEAIKPAQIVFIAVPTPSLPNDAFDTSIVKEALASVAVVVDQCPDYKVISIISTVLPGTTRSEFLPVLESYLGKPGSEYGLCYNAQFIAMGTVINDMLNPEFVLIGEYDQQSGDVLSAFYGQLVDKPLLRMSMENAEVIKVYYNVMIGLKIMYANTMMEVCDKIPGADCDVVRDTISMATERLISPRYLTGGTCDSGPCHPRDQRALSYLAKGLSLHFNPFAVISDARIQQTAYIAHVVREQTRRTGYPIAMMGLTFKPETNLTTDSPSYMLRDLLFPFSGARADNYYEYDPIIAPNELPEQPMVYVISTAHEQFKSYPYQPGSVVVDPWRLLDGVDLPEGVTWRPIGKG